MYFLAGEAAFNNMGYSMSRLDINSDLLCGSGTSTSEADGSSHRPNKPLNYLDHEIAQLTKLKSEPHDHLSRILPGKRELPVSTVKMLAGREGNYSGRGRFSTADCCHVLSRYLPVNGPYFVDRKTTRAYVSQFSADGSLFVAGFQGSNIIIYNVDKGWKVQKNIGAKSLRWTITDTSLSPDQRYLVYASMSPILHIVNVGSAATESFANITEIHDGLDLSADEDGAYSFGIFSVKYSTDGRELVAGSNDDSIYVYDLEANKLSLRILAHTSDVNSVCFADESGHLIYSGSDDNLCKVWDRRYLKAKGKPAGVLMGHLEGITFLDSRGDGRYFISNSKDQSIKLWDIRRMSSNATSNPGFRNYEWDYRWMEYPPQARGLKHPCDQSLATYKGHSVLRTLIRCHFSPEYSTGQRYIYTGSHDSYIYIYDVVSGTQVARLEHHKSTVRDCSWHPQHPMLVSSSFDGDIVRWEFPGDGEAPASLKKKIRGYVFNEVCF
ncbi:LEC14B protein-like isoform X1 [Actinidia eriantha]|uniref:LEC14B protein-like isoform X1 n=2 Tax=Actinidia eriantha TaxID=165200 RepID=UPI00258C47E1|nr:LEC14B protein-like isoform X1 [Actinidia eriantha]XP_057487350.1 LEC14B protein-like isoform X1 [Actinidia eriantha]XP_057487351.1 LEC14B protein-like isoform X1 [Actinidia eriantha]